LSMHSSALLVSMESVSSVEKVVADASVARTVSVARQKKRVAIRKRVALKKDRRLGGSIEVGPAPPREGRIEECAAAPVRNCFC
jgi:hypothetical protein